MNYIENISEFNFLPEKNVLLSLSEQCKDLEYEEIKNLTSDILNFLKKKQKNSLFENLINKFGIGTSEGLGLMELAESLLRVQNKEILYELLFDKIAYQKNWSKYQSPKNGFIVNFLIFCLGFSSYILQKRKESIFHKAFAFFACPVIAKFSKFGVNKIGSQFIMGKDVSQALKNSLKYKKYLFSYDILGEGARSFEQAEFYFSNYLNAIEKIGQSVDQKTKQRKRVSLSIKLSALHPKYEFLNYPALEKELIPKIEDIVCKAAKAGLNITIDAEECARLPVSLMIFEKIFRNPELKNFHGFGLAVQAYNKSAIYVLKFLKNLSEECKKEIPVRLVKGAYWDAEIKKAQMAGLEDFHLFTEKNHTDISYLACASFMMDQKFFYPQFATHNTSTVSAILKMAETKKQSNSQFDFEFQRLQGMGQALHDFVIKEKKIDCRIYAPVGPYHDLLAYLVRRILENGASTSFVCLYSLFLENDSKADINFLCESPFKKATDNSFASNSKIVHPLKIYKNRLNSLGIDFGNIKHMSDFSSKLEIFKDKQWFACPVIAGISYKDDAEVLHCPAHYTKISGKVVNATIEQTEMALIELKKFYHSSWKKTDVNERASVINKLADLLQENWVELSALLMSEVGKTLDDCEGEIREAIDFCRYYSIQAQKIIGNKIALDSYHLGELNELSMHPKGVFVCISPWNFPLAIFLGQIVAALLCGNVVAIKPAEQTPLIAAFALNLMFDAGLDKHAVAFLPGSGSIVGQALVKSKIIAGVAFTGSTETAKIIQIATATNNPLIIPVIAETGGQNCMIVDSTVLPEETVDYIIKSAFGSTGQRCSALRVLYVEDTIFDKLSNLLIEATNVKKLGFSMEDFSVDLGPVIDLEAWQNLQNHLEEMKDKIIYSYPQNNDLKSKGFYIGPHIIQIENIGELRKEIFGPILHIVKYKSSDLDKVIEQINSTGYGLTFGMQTRIESKYKEVCQKIEAGNLYVNRSTIGAIVGVQPFGGMNLSGTGFKAGGPHYLLRFLNEKTYTVNTASARGLAEVLADLS